jgi:hypothetical protein
MYKILKSKKAVSSDDFIPLMFAMFVFVLAFVFLIISSSMSQNTKAEDISAIQENIEGTDVLLSYLRTPVDAKNNIADLIILSHSNDNYENLITATKNNKLITSYESVTGKYHESWLLKIGYSDKIVEIRGEMYESFLTKAKKVVLTIFTDSVSHFDDYELVAQTTIPSADPNNPITLKLIKVKYKA